jgi:hypothetical protein
MAAPPGYNSTSLLPVAGGQITPMMGGGLPPPDYNSRSLIPEAGGFIEPQRGGATHNVVTILGNPYSVRTEINSGDNLEDDETAILELFHVNKDSITDTQLVDFFNALTRFNCDKEYGVLLNPGCEPVRAVLRASLLKKSLKNTPIEELLKPKPTPTPQPLALNMEDELKERGRIDEALSALLSKPVSPETSTLDKLLLIEGELIERHRILEDPE